MAVASITLPLLSAIPANADPDAGRWVQEKMTARYVMTKMDNGERYSYLAGVVEGLAYARYARDNKGLPAEQKTANTMNCVYKWFYDDPKTLDLIYVALGQFDTYTPGAVLGALIKKPCGA